MYGVPANLDLQGLHGSSLTQICVGPLDLQFHFTREPQGLDPGQVRLTGGHTISVEGSWRLVDSSGGVIDESAGRVGDKQGSQSRSGMAVRILLAGTVEGSDVDPPRSFTLRFVSGHRLTVFDDSDQYESFSIQPGGIFV
jgi:hypothetical protein